MTSEFKDHFSDASDDYARYRPTYPAELFDYLAAVAPATKNAWDCATGSGQAAVVLGEHFDTVLATDASATQVESAQPHANVEYAVASAEESGLPADSVDLITVGQAYHWFDAARFASEAKRVLHGEGVLAIWCYETCSVNSQCDDIVVHLYSDLTGEFWPPERALIEDGYRGVELPGAQLEAPEFEMVIDWSVDDMLGYLGTWSACRRYAAAHGQDPVAMISDALREAWGSGERTVRWPMRLRVCRPNAVD